MQIKLVATVMCDYCLQTAQYKELNPEGVTLEEFGQKAKEDFRSVGWRCCEPHPNEKTLCPTCAFNRS